MAEEEILCVRPREEKRTIAAKVTKPVKIWIDGLAGETSFHSAVTIPAIEAARKMDKST